MFSRIYFDDAPLIITDDVSSIPNIIKKDLPVLEVEKEDADNIMKLHFEKPEAKILLGTDYEKLQKKIFGYFKIVEAAGGIVINEEREILFIYRRGKWDLPKGKLEKGEDKIKCAEREIEEETGIGNLKFVAPVGTTYHHYVEKGKHILKESYWYYFTSSSSGKGTPQTEEDISEVKWISTAHIKEPMENTYETIRDIMTTFFDQP